MRRTSTAYVPLHADDLRRGDQDGTTLFYAMSGIFLSLFAFVLWYCPRHL